jgi:hypothetical protein
MTVELRLKKCLTDAVKAGKVTQAGADAAMQTVRDLLASNPGFTQAQAAAAAAQQLTAKAAQQKRVAALSVVKAQELLGRVAARPSDPYGVTSGILVRDRGADRAGVAGGKSVEGQTRAITAVLHGIATDFLNAYRSKYAGLWRDGHGLKNFIRETFGEASGDTTAGAAAKGFGAAAEYAMKRFNAAGGNIRRLDDWGRPQIWDPATVRRIGLAEFETDMRGAIAKGWLKLVDWETGNPLPANRADEIIRGAYQRISTEGASDIVPGQPQGTKLANQRQERRAFYWTSADAWFWANGKYGVGNDAHALFGLVVGHLDGMARDIALLEVLGPNQNHMARVLIDTAKKAGISAAQANRLEAQYEVVSGVANLPVNEGVAYFMREVRGFLTAAKLGSALLSAPTDFATLRQTAAWNDIPASKVFARYLSLFNPANSADRAAAARAGVLVEAWAQAAATAHRHQVDVLSSGPFTRAADVILRASWMTPHTTAGRMAFQVEFLARLAQDVGKPIDRLDPALQSAFLRYGIDAAAWDRIRAQQLFDERGMRLIDARGLAVADAAGADASGRLMQMVLTETDFAIPQPGAFERSLLLGRTKAGTLAGEFWRSATQLKSFPVTMLTTHLMRGLESYRSGDAGKYLAAMGVSLTVMGALAMQLKEIARGRDPRDMTDPKFWGAAFLQGGGAGIFGDFLYAGINRADRSFMANAAFGPVGGLADELTRMTLGNVLPWTTEEKDAKFGAQLARFMRMNTPGTSLWYGRAALDRLLWDRLQESLDPNFARSWREIERRAWKENGQQFWWRPGETAPARGPDFSAALDRD